MTRRPTRSRTQARNHHPLGAFRDIPFRRVVEAVRLPRAQMQVRGHPAQAHRAQVV